MERSKPKTVVGFFASRAGAESATDELWHAGFRHEQIGMAVPGGASHEATTGGEALEENMANATSQGAIAGGILGVAGGAAAVAMVPGVGPLLAGGLLAIGAATGAAVGTFAGPFVAMGFSDEAARRLGDEVKGGRTVLVVGVEDEGQADKAIEVIRSHGGRIDDTVAMRAH